MPAHTVLLELGKHKIVAPFTLAQAVDNLILSLVPVNPFGFEGVALGTAIPTVAFTLVAIVIYFKNYLRVSLMEYVRRSLPRALLVQLPFIALLFLIKGYLPPSLLVASTHRVLLLVTFFTEILMALIPYAILVSTFCVNPTERAAIIKIKERFGFPKKTAIQLAAS
jgi:O-antigen/teichoic acid export membrane protein